MRWFGILLKVAVAILLVGGLYLELRNRNNLSELGQSSSKKMQIESNESRDFRDSDQFGQMSSRTFALLAEEQNEFIEEHSNQIDDMVASIKEDMGILKNVKETR